MREQVLTACLALTISVFSFGQTPQKQAAADKGSSKAELGVLKLEQELKEAGKRGDMAAVERLMADDAIAVFPDGKVVGDIKAKTLALFRSGGDFGGNVSNKDEEVTVRMQGDTAVVVGRQISEGQYQGESITGQVRFTHVWVKKKGRWRLVASQWTLIVPQ